MTMRDVDEMTELLDALADDAAGARKYEALAEKHRERIRANLPRTQGRRWRGRLERTIRPIYVGRTISRWTADDAPGCGRSARKRPGAAPGN